MKKQRPTASKPIRVLTFSEIRERWPRTNENLTAAMLKPRKAKK